MTSGTLYPCFSCALPDCDERSAWCALRHAYSEPYQYRKRGEAVPDDVRRRASIAHLELYALPSRAAKSEA